MYHVTHKYWTHTLPLVHVLVYFDWVWICIISLSRSSVKISSGYYMQSKSDFWLVPSWRRVLCRVLILQRLRLECTEGRIFPCFEACANSGWAGVVQAVLRCFLGCHSLCPTRSKSTRILRDSALALLPAAARGCPGALLCSFAVLFGF